MTAKDNQSATPSGCAQLLLLGDGRGNNVATRINGTAMPCLMSCWVSVDGFENTSFSAFAIPWPTLLNHDAVEDMLKPFVLDRKQGRSPDSTREVPKKARKSKVFTKCISRERQLKNPIAV